MHTSSGRVVYRPSSAGSGGRVRPGSSGSFARPGSGNSLARPSSAFSSIRPSTSLGSMRPSSALARYVSEFVCVQTPCAYTSWCLVFKEAHIDRPGTSTGRPCSARPSTQSTAWAMRKSARQTDEAAADVASDCESPCDVCQRQRRAHVCHDMLVLLPKP
jgi:hypothetical protein